MKDLPITERDLLLAKAYYKKLQSEVEIANLELKTLEEFCEQINGFNFDGELFDVNYGNLCATLVYRNDKIQLTKSVELWTEDCVDTDLDITKPIGILYVSYKDKTDSITNRAYLYTGCTDKKNPQWVNDADKLAKDNLLEGEQVMDYKLEVIQ